MIGDQGDGDQKKTSERTNLGGQWDSELPPEVQGRLGEELRRSYSKLVSEELPDKFQKLLDQLGRASKSDGDKT